MTRIGLHILLSAILISCCFISTAGEEEKALKKGNVGISFNATGLASVAFSYDYSVVGQPMLIGKVFLTDELALRLGLAANSSFITTSQADSVASALGTSWSTSEKITNQVNVGINAGIEKHIGQHPRLSPFIGLDFNLAMLGAKDEETHVETAGPGVFRSVQSTIIDRPNAYAFGLNALIGFHYFFTPNLALGGEVGLGYLATNSGGITTTTKNSSVTNVAGVTTTSITTVVDQSEKTTELAPYTIGAIQLSLFW